MDGDSAASEEEATAEEGEGISRSEAHGADGLPLEAASLLDVASLEASLGAPL